MSETARPAGNLTRRSFLKATAATTAVAAAAGAAVPTLTALAEEGASSAVEEKTVLSRCAFGGCFLCEREVVVRDGHAVNTKPSPREAALGRRPCQRGINSLLIPYYPNRIKYPMKRIEGTERGAEQWERIGWDEALDIVTGKFKEYMAEFGPASILRVSSTGTSGYLSGYYNLMVAQALGWTDMDISVDNALGCGYNRVYGSATWKPSMQPWEVDIHKSKTIIVWGANTSESYVQRWRHLIEAKRDGAAIHCIDPNRTTLAARATKWYPTRHGTDAALALSLCQVILENGWEDVEFIMKESAGAYLVRTDTGKYLRMSDLGVAPTEGPVNMMTGQPTVIDPYVVWDDATQAATQAELASAPVLEGTFTVEGMPTATSFTLLKERLQDYTPEKVSEIVDLPVDDIVTLARACTEGPVHHLDAYGGQAYDGGVQVGWAIALLTAITGQLGKPGAGLNTQALVPPVNYAYLYSKGMSPTLSILDLGSVLETGKFQGEDFPLKALFISGSSTLNGSANLNKMIENVMKFDFVVTSAITYNDNCRYSDVVLPSSVFLERQELQPAPLDCAITYMPKLTEVAYECKDPIDLARELANRMGVGDQFTETDEEIIDTVLDMPIFREKGINAVALKEDPTIWYRDWEGPEAYLRSEIGWTTPTGKLEFYCESPAPRMASEVAPTEADLDHLPKFDPPREAWEGTEAKGKYPLICTSVRAKHRWHTDGYDSPWMNQLEPEPTIRANKVDVDARGLSDGDLVELYNDRGHAVARLYVDASIRPGSLVYPKGLERRNYIAGSFSELTPNFENAMTVNTSFFDTCVEMRAWEGGE